MNCSTCREKLPDLIDKRLAARDAAEVDAHLATCEACQQEHSALVGLLGALDALPSDPPTHRLRAQLMADIETEKIGLDRAPAVPVAAPRRGLPWWAYLLQAAAALALVFGGFVLGERSASQRQLAELRARVDTVGQLVEQSVLQKQATGERLEKVLTEATLHKTDERVIDGLINTMAFDSSVNVRLNALNALYAHGNQEVVRAGVLACLRREPNPLVQVSMIDFLVGCRAREAGPDLRRLAADPKADPDVREAAQRATDLL